MLLPLSVKLGKLRIVFQIAKLLAVFLTENIFFMPDAALLGFF